jgi:hypothetical protein
MADNDTMLEIAFRLLPGIGFFGGTNDLALSMDVNANVDRVILSIDAGTPEFLNIGAVRLFGAEGQELDRRQIIKGATLSSIYGMTTPKEVKERVLNGTRVHSKREDIPRLTITLNVSTVLSRIMILNRNDANGRRSQFLRVKAYDAKNTVFEYVNDSPEKRVSILQEILRDLCQNPDFHIENSLKTPSNCNRIRDEILFQLEQGILNWSVLRLASLLRVFEKFTQATDFEISVCAAIVQKLLGTKNWTNTRGLAPLQWTLCSDTVISQMLIQLNKLETNRTGKMSYFTAGKHRIQEPILVKKKNSYLEALDNFFSLCPMLGVSAIICYGTLLGAVREKSFLTHDDDVDILYFDGSKSREDALSRKVELIQKLKANNCSVKDSGKNFHVIIGGVPLDLFPCWEHEEKLNLMMEAYKYRTISASIIHPLSEITLYDRRYPGPADPEAFLQERYGKGWKISDPFHEWPWPILRRDFIDT